MIITDNKRHVILSVKAAVNPCNAVFQLIKYIPHIEVMYLPGDLIDQLGRQRL